MTRRRPFAPLVPVFCLFVAAGASEAQLAFEGPFARAVPGQPGSSASADFDEDGFADVATGDATTSEVLVFLSSGGGVLPEPRRFEAGPSLTGLVARDFDEDGHVDVATSFVSGSSFAVLFGDGNGSLGRMAEFPVGGNPSDLVAADFDGDGHADLAAVLYAGVVIALGDGAGGFTLLPPVGVVSAASIVAGASADFDGDGLADLALVTLASSSGTPGPSDAFVYRGRGDGTFDSGSVFPVGDAARTGSDVLAADFDRDGAPDLAFADRLTGVVVHVNPSRDGTFTPLGTFGTGGRPSALSAADLDADGAIDLLAANVAPDTAASVLPGDGTGAFGPPLRLVAGSSPRGLAIGDFDADRRSDVAVATGLSTGSFAGGVAVFYNATPLTCRAGGVDAANGPPVDVLFVNDSIGGAGRRIELLSFEPIVVFLASPPRAAGGAPFALYAWAGEPAPATVRALPFGLGESCLPMFASQGPPFPRVVWNNTGRAALGVPTRPSAPAPSIVLSRPRGAGRAVSFTLQGLIADPGSLAARPASPTNSVTVAVR